MNYKTKITSRLIFVLDSNGDVAKVWAPNHIGATVRELLERANALAAEIGGTVKTRNIPQGN